MVARRFESRAGFRNDLPLTNLAVVKFQNQKIRHTNVRTTQELDRREARNKSDDTGNYKNDRCTVFSYLLAARTSRKQINKLRIYL